MKCLTWEENPCQRIILDNGAYDIKFGTADMNEPFPP